MFKLSIYHSLFWEKNPNYIYRYFLESPMSGGGFDHKRGNRHENRHQDSHNSCVVVNDNLGGRRVSLGWDVSIPRGY